MIALGLDTQAIKSRLIWSNDREVIIDLGDGEPVAFSGLEEFIMVGLSMACDSDYPDGRTASDIMIDQIYEHGTSDDIAILEESTPHTVVHGMITSADVREQLMYALNFLSKVSKKIEMNCDDEHDAVQQTLLNEIKELERKLEIKTSLVTVAEQTKQIAIARETRAKEELATAKRKADKQIRKLEHDIARLQKEIEELRLL